MDNPIAKSETSGVLMESSQAFELPKKSAFDYDYEEAFFQYLNEGSLRSARAIIPLVVRELNVQSVLDVGCGAGAWLAEYQKLGVPVCQGADGDYVKKESLLIAHEDFIAQDVSKPFDLGRQFDLVQCLEVAEHLPKSTSETIIANLVRHGKMVLFSAAVPGQGGENHTNERPYEFWRDLFDRQGYKPFDLFRPTVKGNYDVERWYRFNMMLYVDASLLPDVAPSIKRTQILDGQPIPDLSPVLFRIRTTFLAMLPVPWVTRLAKVKRRCVLAIRAVTQAGKS